MGAVDVPESVIDVLTSLRDYLQDKCEPPIYVSDRRFMKALNLLQVAAYADGRDEVRVALCMHLLHAGGCNIVMHAGCGNTAGACLHIAMLHLCRVLQTPLPACAARCWLCHDRY